MLMNALQAVSGLLLLFFGAETLIKGASQLASALGVKPIIIGLTIVAFGTSAPEAIVSFYAAFHATPDIAVGNVVGSNIFNIAFILGLAALIRPLKVDALSLKREIPFVVLSALLAWFFSRDGFLGRTDGLFLLMLFFIFVWFCFFKQSPNEAPGEPLPQHGRMRNTVFLIAGLLFLVLGAKLFVTGSIGIARILGLSELFIGLTIVAAGTSLPELATSVVAAYRKQDDLSVGNVSGSNIFNILFILGIVALVSPIPVSQQFVTRDMPVMIIASLVMIPVLRTGFVITRLEGFILILGYVAYVIWLLR